MSKMEDGGRKFGPEKYNMAFCHECNGLGKVYDNDKGMTVCEVCGGFGLIKKQENTLERYGKASTRSIDGQAGES